ncbi:Nuclear receptor sub 2 group C member 2 [Mortierella sp. AD011]|nr:Nuclear receptor sub 2 group C member 2 [Mortierella sp. AD010]KAF9375961.1 Nuclear receptor sub 2 group C member 2 [Mortierella sp. AD011]
MTVTESPVDLEITSTLQKCLQHIPFEELTRLVYNVRVPGRFGKAHTGRWKEHDVELRQPFGDATGIEKEANLLHKLRHCPQIWHLHGFTVEPTTLVPYFVFQHTEHGSLHSYLTSFHPHLTWSDRYNLALDVALGLRYLHIKGCKHRHLHSASVLIDTNGSAVLSDFGNSNDIEVVSSREHTARMTYLAPERLSRTSTRYSFECDVYSLGMVLWEISSGRPPFDDLLTPENIQNGAMTSLAQNIVAGRRERPVQGVDPIYEDIYTRCWHPNPQERPSIEWVIQTLGVLLKQPSNPGFRQIEELSIVDESTAVDSFKPSKNQSRSMSVRVGSRSDGDRTPSSPVRSRELLLSPREPNYPPTPPPPSGPPPIPPVSQRRKLSAASSIVPTMRSMSISSNSSTGSSNSGAPVLPSRDARRASTIVSPHPTETSQYNMTSKRRAPQPIWEAAQEGNADLVEWHILTTGISPDSLVSLLEYSMLAEVTPVHVACFYQPETLMNVLRTLQRNGANMQHRTTLTNQTALHILLEHATNYNLALEATKYLMSECKLGVNDPDNRGLTPFHKYIKNPNLSAIASVAASDLYSLLREKGQANLALESHNEGNSLGMTARYLRVDLMKLFLLTDLSCSEHKSLVYASSVVEAPLSESRSSKEMQELCRTVLSEWKGERGEKKRIAMAERILEHQASSSAVGSPMSSPSPTLSASPPTSKGKKQGGILGLGKSKPPKEDANPSGLPVPKTLTEVDVAKKILQSTAVKQRKLKTIIADSGF